MPCRARPGNTVDDRSQPVGRDVRDHRVEQPVRGGPCKADGSPDRSLAPIPVRYASADTAICWSTALQGGTRTSPRTGAGKATTGPAGAVMQTVPAGFPP
jgi:hypothetical protein